MLFFSIIQLFGTVLYSWLFIWTLGYHGVFSIIMINLLINFYFSSWELYLNWLNNYSYVIIPTTWIEFGNTSSIYFEFHGNTLTFLLLVMMSSGASIVILFTYVEMWNDKEGANFVILLLLFIAFMLLLTSSGNLFIFFLGWEGMGVVSLFLISFWSERVRSFKATLKVYTMNKIGDLILIVGLLLIFWHTGTTNFIILNNLVPLLSTTAFFIYNIEISNIDFLTFIMMLASGVKSSQFGFHMWLLDAMEAPLGASALMHSSTLVIAGIMLILKLHNFVFCSQINQNFIMFWGSWTALFAIVIACFQYELKIILAYTTISSMGMIYFFMGLNQNLIALNYLVVHAYTKIFFFLTVGLLILNCNGCQDIRWMGQLLHNNADVYLLINMNILNLIGLPFTSGYFAKHNLLNLLFTSNSMFYYYYTSAFLCFIIAYYMLWFRLICVLFISIKNGHRSIYRIKNSNLMVVSILFFSNIILFCNNSIFNNINSFEPALFNLNVTEYNNIFLLFNNISAWQMTTLVFSIALMFFYIFNITYSNKFFNSLSSQFYIFIFTATSLTLLTIM